MADAAFARREARRRKILENCHNRLQRISGKASEENSRETSVQSLISDYEDEISSEPSRSKTLLSNGLLSSSISPTVSLGSVPEEIVHQNEVINDLASLLPSNVSSNLNSDVPPTSSLLYNIVFYKYDLVLLSLFIQILYYFSYISMDGTYFFLPLFIYVSTKRYWCTQQVNSSSSFTNILILMLLKGVSTQRVQKMLNLIQIVSGIGLDACIFVFTTICMQAVYIFLNENFVT